MSEKQITLRLDELVWREVRKRALERGESAQAWVARAIGICLATVKGERITAGRVEPEVENVPRETVQELTYVQDSESDQTRRR